MVKLSISQSLNFWMFTQVKMNKLPKNVGFLMLMYIIFELLVLSDVLSLIL